MGNTTETEKVYSIPQWKANSILIALIGMVGVVMSAYFNNRSPLVVDSPDRYTGTQGNAHEARTTFLEQEFLTMDDVLGTLELEVRHLKHAADACREWRNEHIKQWEEHDRNSRQLINEFKLGIRDNYNVNMAQDHLIKTCMARTQ